MARKQGRMNDRDRRRALGRAVTERLRGDLDELDFAPVHVPAPQVGVIWDESEAELEAISDPDSDDASPLAGDSALADAVEQSVDEQRDNRHVVSDLIGSRSPTVLVRLVHDGAELKPQLMVEPSPATADALAELQALVIHCLRPDRQILSPIEREELLGARPASLETRLIHLTRLAVRGDEEIEVPGKWIFTPNDRVAGRYAGKFAMLPDGLPFSIRLLLEDGRGTKRKDSAQSARTFPQLPDAVQLQVLRYALELERSRGEALPNFSRRAAAVTFRDLLYEALKKLKLAVDKPTEQHVKNLKERLDMNGLGTLFPNVQTRQESYDRTRGDAESAQGVS
jgi:hypothetical protein